jgi:hypothetical protein
MQVLQNEQQNPADGGPYEGSPTWAHPSLSPESNSQRFITECIGQISSILRRATLRQRTRSSRPL